MHRVVMEKNILEANEALADQNREHFRREGVFVVNLMSAPGAGKTSVLERTIERLAGECRMGVIESGRWEFRRIRSRPGVSATSIRRWSITRSIILTLRGWICW